MKSHSLIVTATVVASLLSFWLIADFLAPMLFSGVWSMAIVCIWAVLLGVLTHLAHGRLHKHRGVDGGVRLVYILLLLPLVYILLWHLYYYLAVALAMPTFADLSDLLYYPELWINSVVDWFIVLLAGNGGGGLLGRFNAYQWRFLPVILVWLCSYLFSHLFTVCFRRR